MTLRMHIADALQRISAAYQEDIDALQGLPRARKTGWQVDEILAAIEAAGRDGEGTQ